MENKNILEEFGKDSVYKLFLVDDFDVKVVTSSAVQLVAVSEHLAKLFAGISLLDKELHKQVSHYYEGLLSRATEIETLEGVLNAVHGRIETLLVSSDRLQQNISDPYETVSTQTVTLVRLQRTCDLLRRIIRIMQLSRKLEKQLHNGVSEIVKASQSLNELDYLTDGIDFGGLYMMEKNLQLIKRAREQINNQANVLLSKGIENQDTVNVRTALQVFNNLQTLPTVIRNFLRNAANAVSQKVQKALDVRLLSSRSQSSLHKVHVPGGAAMPLAGNTAAFRTSLWANMEELMGHLTNLCRQSQHLQNILVMWKDQVPSVNFADELEICVEYHMIKHLWQAITRTLTDEFAKAAHESTYIKQAFEVEFPKLLCMFNEFLSCLYDFGCKFTSADVDETKGNVSMTLHRFVEDESGMNRSPEEALRTALAPFESAYLSRCFSRLTDLVNVVYAGDEQNVPTADDVEGIVKAIKSELTAASIDCVLMLKVAELVSQTVHCFVEKCQYLVSTDQNATQVINIPNPSQLVNSRVVNLLYLFQSRQRKVLEEGNYADDALQVIQSSLQSIDALINIVVEPLLLSISSAVEAIIITMHKEDYSMQLLDTAGKTPDAPCSLFMKELQKFIARTQNDYFSLYPDCDAILNGMQMLGSRAVELFIRHASLVRPLGEGGKRKLASDCAQMEMAVSPWCHRMGDLGRVYRLLRSFRPLLFQTSNHVAQSSTVGEVIPFSLALHLLFARAPPELKSPHVVARLSLEEYSHWLDSHPVEKERLVLIKASVEKYVSWVKQKQNKEFCSVYPVMLDLLERGLETNA